MRSMRSSRTKFIVCLAAVASVGLWSPDAVAKKVICIDGGGDAYLNNHEGWSRAGATVPPDIIQVGGSLLGCLSAVESGDTLVIIAHGWNTGEAFTWGGTQYTGFDNPPGSPDQGTSPHPVPPSWLFGLFDVTVKFCSCWSALDPDGAGPDRSLTDKIVEALNPFDVPPPNNTATGFVGTADAGASANLDAPTKAAFNAASACLAADQSWASHPPANRPGANPNQQTEAQAIVDACPGATGTVVTIKYLAPVDGGFSGGAGPTFQLGCVCPTTPPGCGLASFFIGDPTVIPTVSQWGLIAMTLLLLTAGTIVIRRYKAHQPRTAGACT